MGSIVEESKKAKNRGSLGFFKTKKFILLMAVLIVSAGSYYFYNADSNQKKDTTVKQKEWIVKKQDLQITISTGGKVVAEDGVELSFSVSGDLEVEEVYIKEGEEIKKGDKIAKVKTEDLELDLRNTYSSYLSVLADYNDEMAGAFDQDILESENNIKQAELSLRQAENSLEEGKINGQNSIKEAEKNVKDAKDELDDYDHDEDNY
ncbi:biotin/lipoyl-binding protein [bacterium]|nr:biotin/lipoyl-binding protein [bacterium]